MEGFTTKKQQFATVWKMHTAGDAGKKQTFGLFICYA